MRFLLIIVLNNIKRSACPVDPHFVAPHDVAPHPFSFMFDHHRQEVISALMIVLFALPAITPSRSPPEHHLGQ